MKITHVNIPKDFNNSGVEVINMYKLSKLVMIAGKNGSGKTRIFNNIQHALSKKPLLSTIKNAKQSIQLNRTHIANAHANVKRIEQQLNQSNSLEHKIQLKNTLTDEINNAKHYQKVIDDSEDLLTWNLVTTDIGCEKYTSISFVPKSVTLTNPSSYNKEQLLDTSKKVDFIGIGHLSNGALSKIQMVQDRWFNATHQHTTFNTDDIAKAIEQYNLLNNIIRVFLNASLNRDINGEATIFGFSLGKANLSDGQIILIQLAVAIFSQEKSLDSLILFLDEPENHLHPSVIIAIIDRLQQCVPNGQIWISTHSIPLLAHFDPSAIWYVEESKIVYAGSIPEKVLESLLGDENEISKLQDFISLPSQFAINQHAFECLFEPISVMTSKSDRQTLQIKHELLSIIKTDKIKILDYGAGKGRLLANIYESFNKDLQLINAKFEYVAYDPYDADKAQCEAVLSLIYEDLNYHYFNKINSILNKHDAQSFDVIIMCNVLHEVDPKDWLKLFQNDGLLTKLLNKNGVVLIVEDNQMPFGEKAYQKGFIVLDTPQLKELFKVHSANDPDFKISDAEGDGRLKAHVIKKDHLINIDSNSRIKALEDLKAHAQEEILAVRQLAKSYKNGKIHGFWVQQFANASLALMELKNQ